MHGQPLAGAEARRRLLTPPAAGADAHPRATQVRQSIGQLIEIAPRDVALQLPLHAVVGNAAPVARRVADVQLVDGLPQKRRRQFEDCSLSYQAIDMLESIARGVQLSVGGAHVTVNSRWCCACVCSVVDRCV